MLIRHESGFRFDAPVLRRKGSFTFKAAVARTGQHYYADGERGTLPAGYEFRDEEELRVIANQLYNIPVVITHPRGLLIDGAKGKIVGKTTRGWVNGNHAEADVRIDDEEGLNAIDNGYRELSLGYATETDAKGFQRRTRVDHLALVRFSRCGSTCSIRTDCSAQCSCRKTVSRQILIANQLLASRMVR